MNAKKPIALLFSALMLLSIIFLAGCAPLYTQKELTQAKEVVKHDVEKQFRLELQKKEQMCSSEKDKLLEQISVLTTSVEDLEAQKEELERSSKVNAEEKDSRITELESELASTKLQIDSLTEELTTASDACLDVDDYDLNDSINKVYTDNDLPILQDTKIRFDGENLDVHDELILSDNKVGISLYDDKEFGDSSYLIIGNDGVMYKYVFDDQLDLSAIDEDEPLEIFFMGQDLEIISATSSEIAFIRGDKFVMEEGETKVITVGDKEVELTILQISDSTSKARFSVDGKLSKALGVNDNDDVSGVYLYVTEVMPNEAGETSNGDMVEFRIFNDDIVKIIEDGDYVSNDARLWKYNINLGGTSGQFISVHNVEKYYKVDDETPALAVEKRLSLPFDFATIGISELTHQDSTKTTFDFDDTYGESDATVLRLRADGDYFVIGSEKYDELGWDGSVFHYRDGSDWKNSSTASFKYEDTEFSLSGTATSFTFGDVDIASNIASEKLGSTQEEAESDDVVLSRIEIGTRKYDVMSDYGLVVRDVKDNAEDDTVVISIPDDQVEAKLCVM